MAERDAAEESAARTPRTSDDLPSGVVLSEILLSAISAG